MPRQHYGGDANDGGALTLTSACLGGHPISRCPWGGGRSSRLGAPLRAHQACLAPQPRQWPPHAPARPGPRLLGDPATVTTRRRSAASATGAAHVRPQSTRSQLAAPLLGTGHVSSPSRVLGDARAPRKPPGVGATEKPTTRPREAVPPVPEAPPGHAGPELASRAGPQHPTWTPHTGQAVTIPSPPGKHPRTQTGPPHILTPGGSQQFTFVLACDPGQGSQSAAPGPRGRPWAPGSGSASASLEAAAPLKGTSVTRRGSGNRPREHHSGSGNGLCC